VRNVGERDGYTLVLEKGSLLWGAPSIDITDEVIRDYNANASRIGSLGDKLNEGAQASYRGGGGLEAPPRSSTKRSTISR
jgi:hypothetical protein